MRSSEIRLQLCCAECDKRFEAWHKAANEVHKELGCTGYNAFMALPWWRYSFAELVLFATVALIRAAHSRDVGRVASLLLVRLPVHSSTAPAGMS